MILPLVSRARALLATKEQWWLHEKISPNTHININIKDIQTQTIYINGWYILIYKLYNKYKGLNLLK